MSFERTETCNRSVALVNKGVNRGHTFGLERWNESAQCHKRNAGERSRGAAATTHTAGHLAPDATNFCKIAAKLWNEWPEDSTAHKQQCSR